MIYDYDPDHNVVREAEKRIDDAQEERKRMRLKARIADVLDSSLTAVCLLVYILLSLLAKDSAPSGFSNWAVYWTLLFLGSVPGGIYRAIVYKDFNRFPIAQLALFAFLFYGMYTGQFHPQWVILLAIPAYYAIFSPIQRLLRDKRNGKI